VAVLAFLDVETPMRRGVGDGSALKMMHGHARPRASDASIVGWSGTCMAIRLMACVRV
jgi:hypothetical protein